MLNNKIVRIVYIQNEYVFYFCNNDVLTILETYFINVMIYIRVSIMKKYFRKRRKT